MSGWSGICADVRRSWETDFVIIHHVGSKCNGSVIVITVTAGRDNKTREIIETQKMVMWRANCCDPMVVDI